MMAPAPTTAALILALVSCAKSPSVAKIQTPPTRQLSNTVDAGDGDYQIRTLRDRIVTEPDNLQARLDLAKAYVERGSFDLAVEHSRLTATRFPDSPEAEMRLVKILRAANQKQEAADSLDRFLQAHPQTTPEYSAWLGILRDDLGDWQRGEAAHREALKLGNTAYLHNNLGYCLLQQGKNQEAAAELEAAVKLDPQSPVTRNNLGLALADKPQEAVVHWQSVSDPATAHSNMAAVLIEKRDYPAARRELDLALGYNKSLPAALKNLQLVSRLDGKPAFIPARPVQTRWERWRAAVRKAVGGQG